MKTMQSLRKELGVTSQGRVSNDDSVLFHLAFRMSMSDAKKFILAAAKEGISESLYARRALVKVLEDY